MHIKQIIIQGFKSYKDQTTIEPFSPGHNVVVGRNGSGKSNFFAAIRFVLHDAYTKLGQEERQALMHDGLVTTADLPNASAATFVEIIFDNTDHRFPTGKDVVTIRRSISLTKDEYLLDGKVVTKADITNLLQSAGFSKSNPYYIVPQGRITALTNARDSDRLQLLKEVAGTKVYEEHREESLKIMKETGEKKEKINELLQSINSKLSKLEKEKEELLKFQDLDKQKRGIEYVILKKDFAEVEANLSTFEDSSKPDLESTSAIRKEFLEREQKVAMLEDELTALQKDLDLTLLEYQHTCGEKENCSREFRKMQLKAGAIKDSGDSNKLLEKSTKQELDALRLEIKSKEDELAALTETNQALAIQESDLKIELQAVKTQRDLLLTKQGRSRQFGSIKERDAFINGEIASLTCKLQFSESRKLELKAAIADSNLSIQKANSEHESLKAAYQKTLADIEDVEVKLLEDGRAKDRLVEDRKSLWREENKLSTMVPALNEQVLREERHLYGTLDKNTISGLEAVRRITRQLGLEGSVYGPVYELFSVDPIYYTCIEVIAGASLFHVVVENDAVASAILEVMIKEHGGRVTFMPLNRLRPEPLKSSPPKSSNSSPMLGVLKYDKQFEAVFKQIFSKVWIVESLKIGGELSQKYGVNAITLEGDQVSRKGALTGGFIDHKHSRLAAAQQVKELVDKLSTYESQQTLIREQISGIDQQVTLRAGNLQVQEGLLFKLQRESQNLLSKCKEIEASLSSIVNIQQEKQQKLAELGIQDIIEKIDSLKSELGTPMSEKLTSKELADLKKHETKHSELTSRLMKLTQERTLQLAASISSLTHLLQDNLKRKETRLTDSLSQLCKTRRFEDISDLDGQLATLENQLDSLKQAEASLASKVKTLTLKVDNHRKQLESLKTVHEKAFSKVNEADASLTKLSSKKSVLLEQQRSLQNKINELGLVPEDSMKKFGKLTAAQLISKLQDINDKLKAFAHVNRKAFEQAHSYTKERTSLLNRNAELDASASSIEGFIRNLDQQKDDAVLRTFDQVSRYFADIFHKLVPNGTAQLVMQRTGLHGSSSAAEDTSVDSSGTKELAAFSGIGIQVTLNGSSLRMQQLSGGQKSIVALSLIFAIQKCDPAPFYLFDEIDANLDAAHRASVAAMITEMKAMVSNEFGGGGHEAQFITTTFRPEMLQDADKFYGVTFANRVSRVQVISKDAATEFIQKDRTAA